MDLTYTIKRSPKRKKLTITVERDRAVVVHAPTGTSDERIGEIVEVKRQWIYEKINHPQKYSQPQHPPGKELQWRIRPLSWPELSNRNPTGWLKRDRIQASILVPSTDIKGRKNVLRDWFVAKASEKILPRVAACASELGVDDAQAKIVDNRYRWDSCTIKDNVNFNWRLIKAPMFVIDYVIVHELAHLIEPNHLPRFWNIVGSYTATMEKAKAWLKEHGEILEEDV